MSVAGQTCLNHPDRTAVARCVTCHKPLCQECTISTTEGKFCSRACASRAADFRANYMGPIQAKGGLVQRVVKPVIILVVVVVVALIVWKNRHRIPGLNKLFKRAASVTRSVTD